MGFEELLAPLTNLFGQNGNSSSNQGYLDNVAFIKNTAADVPNIGNMYGTLPSQQYPQFNLLHTGETDSSSGGFADMFGSAFKKDSPFMNFAGLGLSGLGAFTGLQSLGLAKDAYDFQKKAYNQDYTNKSKAFNLNLENYAFTKGGAAGLTGKELDAYVKDYVKTRGVS